MQFYFISIALNNNTVLFVICPLLSQKNIEYRIEYSNDDDDDDDDNDGDDDDVIERRATAQQLSVLRNLI